MITQSIVAGLYRDAAELKLKILEVERSVRMSLACEYGMHSPGFGRMNTCVMCC